MPVVADPVRAAELQTFFLSRESLPPEKSPQVLLVAAHPDDETIGAAVLLSRRANMHVVHVTDGSPLDPSDALAAGFSTREQYAQARGRETANALALAGIGEDAILNLHFTDQQAMFHLNEISHAISNLIRKIRPVIVLTHAYEGGHPDHDSVALACHLAQCTCSDQAFSLCEFTGYHAGPGGMHVYEFLPHPELREYAYPLSSKEREFKREMMRKFTSQARTLQPFFQAEVERFRLAPPYDFTQPPHEGKLWYENFNWGVEGAKWREMASQTLAGILHP